MLFFFFFFFYSWLIWNQDFCAAFTVNRFFLSSCRCLAKAERRPNPEGVCRLAQGLSPALINNTIWTRLCALSGMQHQHTHTHSYRAKIKKLLNISRYVWGDVSPPQFVWVLRSVTITPLQIITNHTPIKVITVCCFWMMRLFKRASKLWC